jgi:hypothetical protein
MVRLATLAVAIAIDVPLDRLLKEQAMAAGGGQTEELGADCEA